MKYYKDEDWWGWRVYEEGDPNRPPKAEQLSLVETVMYESVPTQYMSILDSELDMPIDDYIVQNFRNNKRVITASIIQKSSDAIRRLRDR